MKEILSNNRKLGEHKTIALTEEYSAILLKRLPPKLQDPRRFSIPCLIGHVKFNSVLSDLKLSLPHFFFMLYEVWAWRLQSHTRLHHKKV